MYVTYYHEETSSDRRRDLDGELAACEEEGLMCLGTTSAALELVEGEHDDECQTEDEQVVGLAPHFPELMAEVFCVWDSIVVV